MGVEVEIIEKSSKSIPQLMRNELHSHIAHVMSNMSCSQLVCMHVFMIYVTNN